MAIKKSDLYSSLWASCDELRGVRGPGRRRRRGVRARGDGASSAGQPDGACGQEK